MGCVIGVKNEVGRGAGVVASDQHWNLLFRELTLPRLAGQPASLPIGRRHEEGLVRLGDTVKHLSLNGFGCCKEAMAPTQRRHPGDVQTFRHLGQRPPVTHHGGLFQPLLSPVPMRQRRAAQRIERLGARPTFEPLHSIGGTILDDPFGISVRAFPVSTGAFYHCDRGNLTFFRRQFGYQPSPLDPRQSRQALSQHRQFALSHDRLHCHAPFGPHEPNIDALRGFSLEITT